MAQVPNRLAVKRNLRERIKQLQSDRQVLDGSPITDVEIKPQDTRDIATLAIALEKLSPFPNPLRYANQLLNGAWRLEYSTAREIRSLSSLPFGFLVGEINQIIDVATASFENKAGVEHKSGLLSGYVRITASFEPAIIANKPSLQKINVNFKQRFIGITKIIGLRTKLFDPIKVVEARNPEGRTPSLDITYIDDTMRIGRGGDGSLFILTRVG
ncbi:MAG: PAP/fibrillin family protein [Cyanobacteria bacterium P01_E01_bin.35]